jgi:hypothetical protein
MGLSKTEGAKDDGPKRPTFLKQQSKPAEDTGFSRGAFGGTAPAKKEETKLGLVSTAPAELKKESVGPWRSSGPQAKQASDSSSSTGLGLSRTTPAPVTKPTPSPADKKNEKGDDSWSFSGGAGRKGPPPAKK